MRIAHLSDIHFGTEIPELLDALIERLVQLRPDLIVASGDFTMAGRHHEFKNAADYLARMPAPVLATPGNHDLPVYNLFSRFFRPFRRYQRYIVPTTIARHQNEHCAILSLNSARPWDLSLDWSNGRLNRRQLQLADRFFAGAQHAPFRALVVHHPFFVPESLPGFRAIGNAKAMLDVLARRKVHAVLSGHLHQESSTTRKLTAETGPHTLMLLQVATATSRRHRDQPNAFNLYTIGPGSRLRIQEQVVDGGAFTPREERDLTRFTEQPRGEEHPATPGTRLRDPDSDHPAPAAAH